MAKLIPMVLFLLILFLANSFKISCNIILCPKIEKEALISFKRSLKDPYDRLSSWNTSNCCNWKGVVCSNVSGNVHQLHLHGDGGPFPRLQGKINPSLLKLKHLKYLNLSGNEFDGRIPSFIGSLTSLEYLDLSYNQFYGKIPPTIGNLSRLHTLILEDIHAVSDNGSWGAGLDVDSLEWLEGLSQLEHLNMDRVNLTKAGDWVQVINKLPSLVELHLRASSLTLKLDPWCDVNVTSLKVLDLSYNKNLESFRIAKWIFRQSHLVFLDLTLSGLGDSIPTSSNITKLQHIDLSWNDLSTIPDWLYSNKDLDFVSLEYNYIRSSISNAIGNLTSLTTLDLSYNRLSGEIPRGLLGLCNLQELDLSKNMLQGDIPDMFGHIWGQNLRYLSLGGNRLTGNLPMSVGLLSKLEVLVIEDNKMSGVMIESHFANLTKLISFVASGNHLTLNVSSKWNPPFKLWHLYLGSWNLGPGSSIPSWLETQKSSLQELDLSDTGISGDVPTWFWNIIVLNLSHNHLSGNIHHNIGNQAIYLNANQFSGPLPRVVNDVVDINLSNNSFSGGISHFLCNSTHISFVMNLNLGENRLTGEIPNCLLSCLGLSVLNLGNNNFYGNIPNSIGTLKYLISLNLRNNKLSGQIPVSISNCTELAKLDISGNDITGIIPRGIGTSLAMLKLLILRSNKLRGTIPWSICLLNSLQIFDLSNNAFSGRIPSCVGNLTAMIVKRNLSNNIGTPLYITHFLDGSFLESASVTTKGKETHYDTILSLVNSIDLSNNNLSGRIPEELTSLVELKSLNLSVNHLTGLIPKRIGNLKELESLDLSRNALSGEMPKSFSDMSFLSDLNLSCNNLSGRIPESTQLQGMNASSFEGNHLCGPPLTRKCGGDDDDGVEDEGNKGNNQDDKSEIEWLYVVLSLGYAVGFSVCCTTLVLKRSWRRAYFGLVDRIWDKLYVYYHTKCTKPRNQPSQAS